MGGKFLWTIDDVFETVGPTVLVIDEMELAHPVEFVGNVELFQQKLSIPSFLGPRKAFDGSTDPNDIGSIRVQFLLSKEVCE
jgi:hypothetical protein